MDMLKNLFAVAAITIISLSLPKATAQNVSHYTIIDGKLVELIEMVGDDQIVMTEERADSLQAIESRKLVADTTINVSSLMFPDYYYLPVVFDSYDLKIRPDSIASGKSIEDIDPTFAWVDNRLATINRFRKFKQKYMMENPTAVVYNINTLPEAPKQYKAFVDPTTARITVEEIKIDQNDVLDDVKPVDLKRKNWLHKFDGLIQFSQAYNSPNWYQGGNNNLNAIVNGVYNQKLNQAFHPNLMFENTLQYKLAVNNASDDSIRKYSISEDLLQFNSKFGIKAAKRWYYSATMQFKTQLLKNYKPNTYDLKASFLSPGEINFGLGMTYQYITPNKRLNLNASMAPLSYNLKMCLNSQMDPTAFGIKAGHKTVSQYGSNIDCKLVWKIAYNIELTSRLTAFTDYDYIQSDLENTLSFSINKYLSTQIYVHLRYDSQTPSYPDTKWRKLQLKEILSFGFAYKIDPA